MGKRQCLPTELRLWGSWKESRAEWKQGTGKLRPKWDREMLIRTWLERRAFRDPRGGNRYYSINHDHPMRPQAEVMCSSGQRRP